MAEPTAMTAMAATVLITSAIMPHPRLPASGRKLLQAGPVKTHAVAGTRRRMRQSVLKYERMLDVTIEPKAVRLQIGAIRTGREQVHGDVVRAVAGDGKVEGFGKSRDLHERGDAAAIGHVGLGIGHGTTGDIA